MLIEIFRCVKRESDRYMNWCARQGDKERGRQGELSLNPSPCLRVPLSPCLRHVLICAVTLAAGCRQEDSAPTSAATPRPSVALRVLVVNEPDLAEAIDRLRGEWNERAV